MEKQVSESRIVAMISFIGLGKLGLPLACCLANGGNQILGVDKNEYTISLLREGRQPFYEPGLSEIFPNPNIPVFTDSYKEVIEKTDTSIVLVNTQLGDNGYSAELVENVVTDLAINLKNSDKEYHLIIISSTVLPGTLRSLISIIENISGRKFGEGFGLTHVPDFVKLGSVIHDFENPEFFVIGGGNERDIELTKEIWTKIHKNNPSINILTLEEAEIAKISLNAYIVNKITFANFLGLLCEGMENVNVHNITKVIGQDRRISPYFFGSGAPYGGTCFPRDTSAFIKFAKDRNMEAKHLLFSEEVNDMVYDRLLNEAICSKNFKIGILGVAFKSNSPVIVGSPGYKLMQDCIKNGKNVICHDFCEIPGVKLSSIDDVLECDIVFVMHPDKRYSKIKHSNIVDVWGICQ